jgi:hypothetical protein
MICSCMCCTKEGQTRQEDSCSNAVLGTGLGHPADLSIIDDRDIRSILRFVGCEGADVNWHLLLR